MQQRERGFLLTIYMARRDKRYMKKGDSYEIQQWRPSGTVFIAQLLINHGDPRWNGMTL